MRAKLLQDRTQQIESELGEDAEDAEKKLVLVKARLAHAEVLLEAKEASSKLDKARFEEERQQLNTQVIQADRRANEAFKRGTQSKTIQVKDRQHEMNQHSACKKVGNVLVALTRGKLALRFHMWRSQFHEAKTSSTKEIQLELARTKDAVCAYASELEALYKEQLFNKHQKERADFLEKEAAELKESLKSEHDELLKVQRELMTAEHHKERADKAEVGSTR